MIAGRMELLFEAAPEAEQRFRVLAEVVGDAISILASAHRFGFLTCVVETAEHGERFGQRFAVHRFDNLRGVCEAVNYSKKEVLACRKKDPRKHKGTDEESQLSRLTYAAAQGDLKTIKLLASLGVNLGGADYDGRTALHVAASDGQTRVVKYLLSRGVSPSPKDRWGGTPLSDAENARHTRTAALLATNGGMRGRSTSKTPRKTTSQNFGAAGALALGTLGGLAEMTLEEGDEGEEDDEDDEDEDEEDDYDGVSSAKAFGGVGKLGATRGTFTPKCD